MPTAAEVIARKRAERSKYRSISEFKDQVLNVLGFEEVPSQFPQKQIEITALDAEGNEIEGLRTSSQGVVQTLDDLDAEGALPAKLKVISGPSNYPGGKPWFDLEAVEE